MAKKRLIAALLAFLLLSIHLPGAFASEDPPDTLPGVTESLPNPATETVPEPGTEPDTEMVPEPESEPPAEPGTVIVPEPGPELGQQSVTEAVYLPFILRNENFAFHERTDAVIIDAGKEVDGSSLAADDFEAHVRQTRIVDPDYVAYDGPREIIGVYVSEVNDVGSPADTGRYIVIDFPDVGWGDGGSTNDEGYTFDSQYTITYKGPGIRYTDGTVIVPDGFTQTGVVSPVLDRFKYANHDGLDYSYFLSEAADGPLPLVIFFHGGGQGNDIYTPIRFSNGGTVWANPENQAKYPTHVLAPRNATSPEAMHKVKAVIDQWIEEGKVDPNRIYVTGFSMGGWSTWTFLQQFPDLPAAAAPLCPAFGPDEATAQAVAHLPLWVFVDVDDFLYQSVVERYNTFSPYWHDSKLSILPENRLNNPPYNGWKFDGHAVWLPVYNEYVDEERGMLIDWLFAQSKVRGIEEVQVSTTAGTAPTLPGTVKVDINYNATGIEQEERAVTWDEIDADQYASPGTFTVEGTVEGIVEKAVATVTVRPRSGGTPYFPVIPSPKPEEPEETPPSEESPETPDDDGQEPGEEQVLFHSAYIKGFSDGTFRPNRTITRAELAVLLARNLGFDGSRSDSGAFKDVKATHWAAGEIEFVRRAGLMGGDANGNFRPGDPVTRAEIAVIAVRYQNLGAPAGAKSRFADVQPDHWAAASIEAAAAAGILDGYGDGTFRPNQALTRAEAVKVINRLFGRGPLHGVTQPSWPDVPANHWAFREIEEASRDHHYTIRPGDGEQLR